MSETRTFVAAAMPPEAIAALTDLGQELRRTSWGGAFRWSATDTIHLTLKFLGNVPNDRLEAVFGAVVAAAADVEPFALDLGGLGCFPNVRRPSVLWVGIHEPSGRLEELARRIDGVLAPEGWPREERPYHPHLTIARLRPGAARDQLMALAHDVPRRPFQSLASLEVESIFVYGSRLTPSGPTHTPLCECPLGAAAPR